jgi:hypothetical protein
MVYAVPGGADEWTAFIDNREAILRGDIPALMWKAFENVHRRIAATIR